MKKFKVGNRVKIVGMSKRCVSTMEQFIGNVYIIKRIEDNGYILENNIYLWPMECLSLQYNELWV